MDGKSIKDVAWQDITSEFMSSVKQLNLGELLKCDQFTLLEAMSALELMDPKMDSGMMLKKTNRKILNLEQSVRMGLVKTNNLELKELIGIIDETYACLATWLEGHSLAQTVMTNLYLHEPERIEDRCLRIFSQSILKLVDFLVKLVQAVYCIEEEDFQLNVCFNLANQISDQKLLTSLEDLCQCYEKILTDLQSNNPNQNGANDSNKQPPEYDKTHLSALIDRLRFTYNLYACFLSICRFLLKNYSDVALQTDAQLLKTTKLIQNSLVTCDQHLLKCLKYLDRLNETLDLGIKNEPEREENVTGYPTIMGFEPMINYKLLPPGYPRCPAIKSRKYTVEYLKDLIIRLRECISISNPKNQRSFNKSLDSIEQFSKYFKPTSCVISRSLVQALYLPNRSTKLLKDELLQSICEFCEPFLQKIRKDNVKYAVLDEFLNENLKTFTQAINIYGHNTARQHERFPELILSFKNLQFSALLLNRILNNNIVYSWVTYNLSRLCIKYVLSGLELELFSAYEYPYIFWYLYDILYRNEREGLEIAKQSIFENQFLSDSDNSKKSKGKKQRKKNQYSTSFHERSLLCNDAFRFLTGGTFLLTFGLKLQGKVKSPLMNFTCEEICFDQRFCVLTGTSVYESYRQTLTRLENPEHIYREALEYFSDAKEIFQELGEHEDCLKVCKTNMVVARILASNLNSFNDREVECSFDTHPSFPTVKV